MSTLLDASRHFTASYHARPDLVAEQRGWSRTVVLVANDSDQAIAIHVDDGRVAAVAESDADSSGDVVITSETATLLDILELRRSPNLPYLFGELTVRGPEADFLRLDYLLATLCPQ